ncbi:MAG: EthD domain-containing protein, partial [Acidimicrobiales bacterium]
MERRRGHGRATGRPRRICQQRVGWCRGGPGFSSIADATGYPRDVVKLVFCLHRRSDVDEAEFHRYWREVHGPLAASFAPV